MHFQHSLFIELPFILNVPDGNYDVALPSGNSRVLTIRSNFYGGSDDAFEYASGKAFGLKQAVHAAFPEASHVSVVKLRTVIELRLEETIEGKDAAQPTESDLENEVMREMIRQRLSEKAGEALKAEARVTLANYSNEVREGLRATCLRRLTARKLFPPTLDDEFLAAVNAFIRQYMVAVGDFFVEELALHQVTGTTVGGILRDTRCEGLALEAITTVGLIPPIMRSQWFEHPKEKIEVLKKRLAAGNAPDAVELLGIRARHLVERGAHRSAIIEAAAAMETAIARRLIVGLIAQGKAEADAVAFLKVNQRFSERGKMHFKTIIGKSLADHDAPLWNRVVVHRDNLRHKIAHSDLEPSARDSKAVVDDFLAMAKVAQTIT